MIWRKNPSMKQHIKRRNRGVILTLDGLNKRDWRLYEGMNITGVTGLTAAQTVSMKVLGAHKGTAR